MTRRTNARVLLLLQRAGLGDVLNWSSPITWSVWLPMLVFEMTFAVWLIIKGVAAPAPRPMTLRA